MFSVFKVFFITFNHIFSPFIGFLWRHSHLHPFHITFRNPSIVQVVCQPEHTARRFRLFFIWDHHVEIAAICRSNKAIFAFGLCLVPSVFDQQEVRSLTVPVDLFTWWNIQNERSIFQWTRQKCTHVCNISTTVGVRFQNLVIYKSFVPVVTSCQILWV